MLDTRHSAEPSARVAGSGRRASAATASAAGVNLAQASLLANDTSCVERLDNMVERARRMLDAGAFVHHYAKAGCSATDLAYAIEATSAMADAYRRLTAP